MAGITIAKALDLQQQFDALDPPPQVKRACNTLLTLAASGETAPRDLINYVQSWLARRQQQDRYGKARHG